MKPNFYDVLQAYNIEYDERDNSVSRVNGRRVMFASHSMYLFVGSENFDRWSSSTEYEFDLSTDRGIRAALRWLN